jgi:hypothetical protein
MLAEKGQGLSNLQEQLALYLPYSPEFKARVIAALGLAGPADWATIQRAVSLIENRVDLFTGLEFLVRLFLPEDRAPLDQFWGMCKALLSKVTCQRTRGKLADLLWEVASWCSLRGKVRRSRWRQALKEQRVDFRDLLSLIFD